MKSSLYIKLLAGFVIVIAITLAIVLFGISAFMKDQVIESRQQDLIDKGTELAQSLHTLQPNDIKVNLANADYYLNARIWILDQSRQIVAMSGQHTSDGHNVFSEDGHGRGMGQGQGLRMRSLFSELDAVYRGEIMMRTMEQPYYGEKMVIVAVPIQQEDGTVTGVVLLNSPVTVINTMMQRIYYYAGIGGAISLILAVLMVSYFAKIVVKPLKEMGAATSTLAKGNYTVRVAIKSKDEVGRLGESINSLAQDLANYMEEIEKTEKLRRDFIANVSHELRTPLTIMRGYAEGILDGTIEEEEKKVKYLSVMRDEIIRLQKLVENLLNLSRLQNETSAMEMEELPLAVIADSVIQMIRTNATKKNITLQLNADNDLPSIYGSGDHIIQLLLILLDNAVKYTSAGGKIQVVLSLTQDQKKISLMVRDSGIGIPAEDLPYIWERFYKVDKSHSRLENGTGLGLAIAAQIIDRHAATRVVSSEINKGTTFIITIPVYHS